MSVQRLILLTYPVGAQKNYFRREIAIVAGQIGVHLELLVYGAGIPTYVLVGLICSSFYKYPNPTRTRYSFQFVSFIPGFREWFAPLKAPAPPPSRVTHTPKFG
jgi:hypothetical protein